MYDFFDLRRAISEFLPDYRLCIRGHGIRLVFSYPRRSSEGSVFLSGRPPLRSLDARPLKLLLDGRDHLLKLFCVEAENYRILLGTESRIYEFLILAERDAAENRLYIDCASTHLITFTLPGNFPIPVYMRGALSSLLV